MFPGHGFPRIQLPSPGLRFPLVGAFVQVLGPAFVLLEVIPRVLALSHIPSSVCLIKLFFVSSLSSVLFEPFQHRPRVL